jgi:hypothetical protein
MDEKKVQKTVENSEVARRVDPTRITKPLEYYERTKPPQGKEVERAHGWAGSWARGDSWSGGGRER